MKSLNSTRLREDEEIALHVATAYTKTIIPNGIAENTMESAAIATP